MHRSDGQGLAWKIEYSFKPNSHTEDTDARYLYLTRKQCHYFQKQGACESCLTDPCLFQPAFPSYCYILTLSHTSTSFSTSGRTGCSLGLTSSLCWILLLLVFSSQAPDLEHPAIYTKYFFLSFLWPHSPPLHYVQCLGFLSNVSKLVSGIAWLVIA